MAVLLTSRARLDPAQAFDAWVALDDGAVALDTARRLDTAAGLEQAFHAIAPLWWRLARELGEGLTHTTVCAPNASDFGLMLAWARLVEAWAGEARTVMVICDDPWLFRHLATLPGVRAAAAPPVWRRALALRVRGILARARYAVRAARQAWGWRHRRAVPTGAAWIMAYGHPASSADGLDAYFGSLMRWVPELRRVLHVDAAADISDRLAADGRTVPLAAWGSPWRALACLPLARWRPSVGDAQAPWRWLIRRAAALEGGTGTAAAILWQRLCQQAWAQAAAPRLLLWPWEHHAWERALVRMARPLGVRLVGYQHSTIGRQFNFAVHSLPGGSTDLPDAVWCNGAATRDQLLAYGLPAERLAVMGALRNPAAIATPRDAAAPVFLALPFDTAVALQMIAAARAVAAAEPRWRFLAKEHPLFPVPFADDDAVRRTTTGLGGQPAVAAVVFAATTVGQEALLAGLPTIRFRPAGRMALDPLPPDLDVAVTDAGGLAEALRTAVAGATLAPPAFEHFFAPADAATWTSALRSPTP